MEGNCLLARLYAFIVRVQVCVRAQMLRQYSFEVNQSITQRYETLIATVVRKV